MIIYDEEPKPLTIEQYAQIGKEVKGERALKSALSALSIIAVMGDHHSAKIAKKAIDAIAEEAK